MRRILSLLLALTLLKAGLNSALTLSLYKPLVGALRKVGLVETHGEKSSKAGLYIFAGILLITCILLLLVFQGKL